MITISFRPIQLRSSSPKSRAEYAINGWRVSNQPHIWSPPTDILEFEDYFLVRMEIAGMDESAFEIILDQNILIISGSRSDISERRAYHQMEISFGDFLTPVEIPGQIKQEEVSAEYRSGFLLVTLPKSTVRQIRINE